MSYNHVYPRCCLNSSSNDKSKESRNNGGGAGEFKLYQFFVFCVPIFFTFILLFLFYLFYLRPRRLNWSSLRMTTTTSHSLSLSQSPDIATVELGLTKELREMLPIIVYKESFSVRDTQCSVCLGDYQAEDRLQQIPFCGHTFHVECIDSWLSTHNTCPLCRLSLLSSHKSQNESPDLLAEPSHESSVQENIIVESLPGMPQACEEIEALEFSGLRNGEPITIEKNSEEDARSSQRVDSKSEGREVGTAPELHEHTGGSSA